MTEDITISLLLKPENRNRLDIKKIIQIVHKLGLKESATGRATISVKLTREKFDQLFNASAVTQQPEQSMTNRDFGARAGYVSSETIPIPEELQEYVSVISVEPPATRLTEIPRRHHANQKEKNHKD